MKIAIVNRATAPIDPADLDAIAEAVGRQLDEFAVDWGMLAPECVRVAEPADLAADEIELARFDDPDQPGAAGYHDVDPRGKPYGRWFASTCDGVRTAPTLAEATVASHEACELFRDPDANEFSMRADGVTLDATEVCDAVEDITYTDDPTGCTMSDYLLPAAFDVGASGPFDRCHALSAATDTTPGGYRITIEATQSGSTGAVAHYGPKNALARDRSDPVHAAKRHKSSRAHKRRVVAFLVMAALAVLALFGCTTTQARVADTVAIDLTSAVCSAVSGQPAGQAWVDIVCTVAEGVEQGVATLLADGGAMAQAAPVRTVRLRMSAADAQAFLAVHGSSKPPAK